jgi:hypothetical protein
MALKSQRAPTSTKSPALALVIPTGVDQDSTFDSRVANQVDSECKPSSAVSTLVCAQKKRGKKKAQDPSFLWAASCLWAESESSLQS